ncbi:hypothetical protein [Streptomyces mayteni]
MTRTQRILAVCFTTVACVVGVAAPALAVEQGASAPTAAQAGDNWGTTSPATTE